MLALPARVPMVAVGDTVRIALLLVCVIGEKGQCVLSSPCGEKRVAHISDQQLARRGVHADPVRILQRHTEFSHGTCT